MLPLHLLANMNVYFRATWAQVRYLCLPAHAEVAQQRATDQRSRVKEYFRLLLISLPGFTNGDGELWRPRQILRESEPQLADEFRVKVERRNGLLNFYGFNMSAVRFG